jgi:glycosyltransferase involved in cell wall biosynthesis
LPACKLLIAGGPERGAEGYEAQLKERAEGLPVEWLGEVDVSSMLSSIELFLMISEPAGCPNASLEAMAMGLPVIATDVGGASEQVQDDHTGVLVPRGDVRAFAEALVLLGQDRAKREALGRGARRRVEERFEVRRMVTRYREILLRR